MTLACEDKTNPKHKMAKESPTEMEVLNYKVAKSFKAISENFTKLEKRLETIEEFFSMNKQSEIISQNKLLEEMVNTNKDSIIKIEVNLKEVDKELKISTLKSSSTKNNLKDERRCKFWNAGYCKLNKTCPFSHPVIICSESKCTDKTCKKRHPRTCKNWEKGFCKFSDLCEFTHEEKIIAVAEQNKNLQN